MWSRNASATRDSMRHRILILVVVTVAAFTTGVLQPQRTSAASASTTTVGIWYSTWYTKDGAYLWAQGHGVGTSKQFLADVTGDGKADSVVSIAGTGEWWVAPSTGSNFAGYSQWISGHGVGSTWQMFGDVNGDGKADAVTYHTSPDCRGCWYRAVARPGRFEAIDGPL